eukprot:365218-Chlamydomonas_euryale.AAC.7
MAQVTGQGAGHWARRRSRGKAQVMSVWVTEKEHTPLWPELAAAHTGLVLTELSAVHACLVLTSCQQRTTASF